MDCTEGQDGCNGGRAEKSKPGVESWFSGGNGGESKTGAKDGEIRTCGIDVKVEGEAEDEAEDR